MRVYYFNDESAPLSVYTGTLSKFGGVLQPAEGKLFEFSAPDDAIPFVKRWHRTLLISYIDVDGGGSDE